ncbi:MAG: DbpA RNA binding domain-containing protein [Treponema sp.]|nr:DbpA RNA binding domain-containing protein [Treponema sp.]
MPVYFNREKAKNTVGLILDKIRTEADPGLLADYYALFKKNVSMFNRSKVAAYLLMEYDQGKLPRSARNNPRAPEDDAAASDAPRSPSPPLPAALPEDESKRLFFSVGRSRRVFPREIIGLINTNTSVTREDIGVIRILDNYSFVQVRNTVAETIIEALNGVNFRGRPLTVNYAKSRSEQDQNHTEEEDI